MILLWNIFFMKEIKHFTKNIPKDERECMVIDELLSYWDLQWELFQCYMDNNWVKCKWLYDWVEYLTKNPDIENILKNNLEIWKRKLRNLKQIGNDFLKLAFENYNLKKCK